MADGRNPTAAIVRSRGPMIDFQQLYEHVPVPLMVLDRQLKYVAANRAYLEITASTFEALAGRNTGQSALFLSRL